MNYPYHNFYPLPNYPPGYPIMNEGQNPNVQNQSSSQQEMYPQVPTYPYPPINPYPIGGGPICPPIPPGGIYFPPTEFVIEPVTTASPYPLYPGIPNTVQQPLPGGGIFHPNIAPIDHTYPPAVDPGFAPGVPYLFQRYYPSAYPSWKLKMPEGTVKYYQPFNPEDDAQQLRSAMKGLGTDEAAIIDILAHRTNQQRQEISVAYKTQFGRDLVDDLNSELSGRFEDVINALMMPVVEYIAKELRHALSGAGTDEDVLIEILCSSENKEILAIKEAYQTLFDRSLEDDLVSDTSGDFRRLLVSMTTGARNDGYADPDGAKQDAQDLYNAGEGQWGTDESVFNMILATRSWDHLAMVFYEYQQLTGHTMSDAVEREFSGDVKQGWLTVVHCVEYRPSFFAERINKAMKGAGTCDRDLIRLIVTRCEKDLVQIKQEYYDQFGKTLEEAIEDDTSGDYKRMLLALVSGM
ncbi:annexin A13-like [Centruroides sculpturatus]|uniref:annexin A13-like n=1 Tax=Centruroides sculpturatus TaxID=218467 RepID=UPI000C6D62C0|nr:annexin A13-like [Centruroides sculpturatus]